MRPTTSVRTACRALDAHLLPPRSLAEGASQDIESPAGCFFDPILSRQIDMATVLSEDGRRSPGERAMAHAWLQALTRLVPDA